MDLVLLSLEDDHGDIRTVLLLVHLLLHLTEEPHVDVDVLVWLKLALHGSDCEDLSSSCLLHLEVKAYWVLTLVLEVEWKLLGLSNSYRTKVKLGLDSFIEGDLESLCINLDGFLLLLDSVVLNILYFELECFKELLLFQSIKFDLNDLALSWLKSTTSPSK